MLSIIIMQLIMDIGFESADENQPCVYSAIVVVVVVVVAVRIDRL